METLWRDLRHALRILGRSPGFALAAILTLGLAIAANTTVFGFMNALLLRPFTLPDLDRLVTIWERHLQQGSASWGGDRNRLAAADFLDLHSENPALASVAAYRNHQYVVTGAGEPERVLGYLVTPGYFETMGLRPALGRTFLAQDGEAGREAVVILSHGFWQRRFVGDPAVVGQTLVLDGRRTSIVGVLPSGVNFPLGAPGIFGPLAFSDAEKAERRGLSVLAVGRLAEGVRLPGAQAAMDAFAARLARGYPDTNAGRQLLLVPLPETQSGVIVPFLLLFEGAAAFVLLIACANVASLLLARGAGRQREIALRAALGAGRGRIVRQLLTEGLVLMLLGAALGLVLAQAGVDAVRASVPPDIVRWVAGWSEIRIDGRTLAFTLAIAVAATLAFALLPAVRAARVDLVEPLKAGGRGPSGPPRRRLRNGLVVVQVTLALVLLAGAQLMIRGFLSLADVYQGFDTERVVTMRLSLPPRQYPEGPRIAEFYERVLRGLEAAPGVESAGLVSHLPADLGPIPRRIFGIEGRPAPRPQERPSADFQTVSAGYLPALGIALRSGRNLRAEDGAEAPPVALVSESLARRFWANEDPVGRRVQIGDGGPWHTVVGVVSEVKQYWFDREPRPTLYVSYLQSPRAEMNLVVRSSLPPAAVIAAARAHVGTVDRDQPVDEIRTMATVVSESASVIRLAATLMVALGGLALLLAGVGLYGVMADHVAQRSHEIGVRMALGARSSHVLGLVVGEAGRLTAIGLVLGLVGAWALGRFMSSAFFGLVRPDLGSLLGVALALAGVGLAAAWVPARRAVRVDPIQALREE